VEDYKTIVVISMGVLGFLGWTLRGLCEQTYFIKIGEWVNLESLISNLWKKMGESVEVCFITHYILALILALLLRVLISFDTSLQAIIVYFVFMPIFFMQISLSVDDHYRNVSLERNSKMIEAVVKDRAVDISNNYEEIVKHVKGESDRVCGILPELDGVTAKRIVDDHLDYDGMYLDFVCFITVDAARELCRFKKGLSLDGLLDLDDRVAFELRNYESYIYCPPKFVKKIKKYKELDY